MNTPPITLVTAAAGKTGRHTALSLLSRGLPVRAMVHREDARSAALRRRGAEIVVGNVSDVHDVRNALDGVQRAYWAAPVTPQCPGSRHPLRCHRRGEAARGGGIYEPMAGRPRSPFGADPRRVAR